MEIAVAKRKMWWSTWSKRHSHVFMVFAFVVVYIILLAVIAYAEEGWTFGDSMYFSVVTISTIGYGDLVPTTTTTKVFAGISSFVGVGAFFYLISTFSFRDAIDTSSSHTQATLKKKKQQNKI